MGYSQYSEHRRPPPAQKVRRVEHYDGTGEDDRKLRKQWEKALDEEADRTREANAPKKRSFSEALKKKR
jgi:hypothetical protein